MLLSALDFNLLTPIFLLRYIIMDLPVLLTEIDNEFAAKYKLNMAKNNVKSEFHVDDIEADLVELNRKKQSYTNHDPRKTG